MNDDVYILPMNVFLDKVVNLKHKYVIILIAIMCTLRIDLITVIPWWKYFYQLSNCVYLLQPENILTIPSNLNLVQVIWGNLS